MSQYFNMANRPSFFWLISEPGRALTELGVAYSLGSLLTHQPKGDGHPVMILPGFMASKSSTTMLRSFVEKLGYEVYDWGLGRNLGREEYIDLLSATIEEIYSKAGRPVSLVGWSLGGVFARQLAKARPHLTRQVITLGSPFGGITEPNNAAWLYSMISGGKKIKDINYTLLENLPIPAPVPTTAIYSKEDGIVPWQMCMERQETDIHQNIQVRGSHIGLGVNTGVLEIIADRLQYQAHDWQHFKPKNYMKSVLFYPSL